MFAYLLPYLQVIANIRLYQSLRRKTIVHGPITDREIKGTLQRNEIFFFLALFTLAPSRLSEFFTLFRTVQSNISLKRIVLITEANRRVCLPCFDLLRVFLFRVFALVTTILFNAVVWFWAGWLRLSRAAVWDTESLSWALFLTMYHKFNMRNEVTYRTAGFVTINLDVLYKQIIRLSINTCSTHLDSFVLVVTCCS